MGAALTVDAGPTGRFRDVVDCGQAIDGAVIEDQFAVVYVQDNGDADGLRQYRPAALWRCRRCQ